MSLCTHVMKRLPAGGGLVRAELCDRPGAWFGVIDGGHVVRCEEHTPWGPLLVSAAAEFRRRNARNLVRTVIALALLAALAAAFTNGWLWG